MKYCKEERLEIGHRIYDGELSCYEAAEQYGINHSTARDYMRLYRDLNHLPPKNVSNSYYTAVRKSVREKAIARIEDYECMSKEELIQEIIMARNETENTK